VTTVTSKYGITHQNNTWQHISYWMSAKWSLNSLKLNSFFLANNAHFNATYSVWNLGLCCILSIFAEVSKFLNNVKSYKIFVDFNHPLELTSCTVFLHFSSSPVFSLSVFFYRLSVLQFSQNIKYLYIVRCVHLW